MQFWLEVISIVAGIALIVQVIILGMLFFELKKTTEKVNKLTDDLQARFGPIMTRVQLLLDDTQPKISTMVNDAAHMVYLARGQAQKLDRVITDTTDRFRGQLIHADRILTSTLDTVEETGTKVRQGIWGPVKKASAMVQGIKVGLDFLRTKRGDPLRSDDGLEQAEEELFI